MLGCQLIFDILAFKQNAAWFCCQYLLNCSCQFLLQIFPRHNLSEFLPVKNIFTNFWRVLCSGLADQHHLKLRNCRRLDYGRSPKDLSTSWPPKYPPALASRSLPQRLGGWRLNSGCWKTDWSGSKRREMCHPIFVRKWIIISDVAHRFFKQSSPFLG